MQGRRRPCQDSICSVLACLWPHATALGNGSVLETHSLVTEFVLKAHSLVRNEITHFLGAKKFLFVPLSGERRDTIWCILAWGSLDGTASSPLYTVPSSTAKWLIHLHSAPSAIVWTHTCSIVRHCGCPALCLPGTVAVRDCGCPGLWLFRAEVTMISHLLTYQQWTGSGGVLPKLLFSGEQ